MRSHLFRYGLVTGAAATLVAGAMLVPWGRVARAQGSLNLVYVEVNGSVVLGYSNDGNGNLTPLSGSPYAVGSQKGALEGGTGYTFLTGSCLLINPEGTFLFATAGYSDTISEFSVNSDGSLTGLAAVLARGQDTAALGFKDNALAGNTPVLLVVNKDDDDQPNGVPNYTPFSVSPTGALTQAAHAFNLPAGSTPWGAAFVPNENKFFGVLPLLQQVTSYQIKQDGQISQINEAGPPSGTDILWGAVVHPTSPALYVSAFGDAAQDEVLVYNYDHAGNLTYSKTVANPGSGAMWMTMNAGGSRLYTVEQNSSTVTVYNTTAPGNPVQLQHVTITLGDIQGEGYPGQPTYPALDPTGKFLYVTDAQGYLYVLQVAPDGAVTEPTLPIALFKQPSLPIGLATLMK